MFFQIDLAGLNFFSIIIRFLLAVIVGGILGVERGSKAQAAGLRTYILVTMGAAMIMMTNQYISEVFHTGDPSRLGAQVVSGIGFIGAGTIMVTQNNRVKGLTTAASIWAAAGIGLAIGIGFYEGAIAGALILLLVMTFMLPVKQYIQKRSKYVEVFVVCKNYNSFESFLARCARRQVEILRIQNGTNEYDGVYQIAKDSDEVGYYLLLKLNERFNHKQFITEMSQKEGIHYIEEIK